MQCRAASLAVLGVLALGCAGARGDEARRTAPEDPDPGFLEFLGSVDRLAEVNPNYLSQSDPARVARAAAKPRVAPPPPAPPPSPGAKNNE